MASISTGKREGIGCSNRRAREMVEAVNQKQSTDWCIDALQTNMVKEYRSVSRDMFDRFVPEMTPFYITLIYITYKKSHASSMLTFFMFLHAHFAPALHAMALLFAANSLRDFPTRWLVLLQVSRAVPAWRTWVMPFFSWTSCIPRPWSTATWPETVRGVGAIFF